MKGLEEAAGDHVVKGTHNRRSHFWDIIYMVLEYQGQMIEIISDRNINILDTGRHSWIRLSLDFSRFQRKKIWGLQARIMDRQDLIPYKSLLNRDVDIQDIRDMKK